MSLPAALPSPQSEPSQYADLRDPTRFHTDPQCSVGRWIPVESMYLGRGDSSRPCPECALGEDRPKSFLFAI
jgi:hypothetical protein